ncbi:DUF2332 domain-containing protein [Viridibacillus sp. YIM B01967]|uniref:DUF2332 domain-containing protein n=1 Tax=Viridibacillus soli TaxID=2798301 RepID=A0ABS1H493_9BACL|nr:DUF2332 domain-containing protein [Viridibacillus soli]MBK3494231.1 DUF2332 domain-containing protein [Viridibacillus soli]
MIALEKISRNFSYFAKTECAGSSDLYECLSYEIAKDSSLLTLASKIPQGQPIPNLFFASVHYLLETSESIELMSFYKSFESNTRNPNEAFPYFKNFCLEHEEMLISLFQTKLVQTNEVRRCAYLYPIFTEIYARHHKPLALIEIGTSAGLQLGLDQYAYQYNEGMVVGKTNSKVLLTSDNKGTALPGSIKEIPLVSNRIGIDLHTNDLNNVEDVKWLQALIWPEHTERRTLFNAATEVVQDLEIELIDGNAVELLEEIVQKISPNSIICVFHTHVGNQIPHVQKELLVKTLHTISQGREIYHVYNNLFDTNLHRDYFFKNTFDEQVFERPDGHARWFTWK